MIPPPLDSLFSKNSLKKYYPKNFKIDISGKRREWEGIVLLPKMNIQELNKEFTLLITEVDQRKKKLNKRGQSYIITHGKNSYIFKSFYGDITECKTQYKTIQL